MQARLGCFAVRRGDIKERADVGYAADLNLIRARYARPCYDLVLLGSITTLVQYGTSKRADSDQIGTPVLRIPNLQIDGWDLTDLKYLELSPAELATYRLKKGDILFNRTNGSRELVGKCEVFDFDGDWVFASYLIRLRINESLANPKFISAFLNTKWGRRQVEHVSRQILMSNINAEEIRALRVPLPDRDLQNELLGNLENARRSQLEKLKDADDLLVGVDSVVLDTLSLDLSHAESEQTTYAIHARNARAARKLYPDYFHPERIRAIRAVEARYKGDRAKTLIGIADFIRDQRRVVPGEDYLGLANVQSGTGERIQSSERDGEGQCFEYQAGDVLFARLRPYLNKVYRAESSGVCSTEFHVIRIRTDNNGRFGVAPDYLAAVMRSSIVLAQTRHMMTGNTHPRLANEDVVNLVIPIPVDGQQQRIANEVARRREEARRLRSQALMDWEAAKCAFEEALLGPYSGVQTP